MSHEFDDLQFASRQRLMEARSTTIREEKKLRLMEAQALATLALAWATHEREGQKTPTDRICVLRVHLYNPDEDVWRLSIVEEHGYWTDRHQAAAKATELMAAAKAEYDYEWAQHEEAYTEAHARWREHQREAGGLLSYAIMKPYPPAKPSFDAWCVGKQVPFYDVVEIGPASSPKNTQMVRDDS